MNSESIKNITNQATEQLIETLKAGKSDGTVKLVHNLNARRAREPFR